MADTVTQTQQTPVADVPATSAVQAPDVNPNSQTAEEHRAALETAKTKLKEAINRDNIRRDLLAEEEDAVALSDVQSNARLSDSDNQSRLEALIDFRAYNDVQYYQEKLKKENIFTTQEQEEILQVAKDVRNPVEYVEQDADLKDKLTDLMAAETISREDAEKYVSLKDSYSKKRPITRPVHSGEKEADQDAQSKGKQGSGEKGEDGQKPEKMNPELQALKIKSITEDLENLQELIGKETDPETRKRLQEKEKELRATLKELEEMKIEGMDNPAKSGESRQGEKEGTKGKGSADKAGSDGLSGALSSMNPQGTGRSMPVTTQGKPDDAAIQRLMNEAQPVEEQKSWWERNKTWLLWTISALALGTVAFLGFRKGGWWNKDKKENTTTPSTETATTDTTNGTTTAITTNQNSNNGSTLENSATKVNTDTVEQLNNALTNNSRSL